MIKCIQDTSLHYDLRGVYFEDSCDLVTSQKEAYLVYNWYSRYFKTYQHAEEFLSGA